MERLKSYLDRPWRLDELIHGVIDLAEVSTDLYIPSRSIFSKEYILRPRAVMGKIYLDLPPTNLFNKATFLEEVRLLEKMFNVDESIDF